MIFDKNRLYHIYNQGNNKQNIFYNKDNYLFFLKKVKIYILPYADILSWCLMPNHFHLMVLVNEISIPKTQGFTLSETLNKNKSLTTQGFTRSETLNKNKSLTTQGFTSSEALSKIQTFNDSIGILLRTYTRAINKQEKRSGALFRKATKAECIDCFKGVKPSFIQSNLLIYNHLPEKQYPQICFDYIHQNPVKANLVKNTIDWEFSSAIDYAGLRNGKLINKPVAEKYIDHSGLHSK